MYKSPLYILPILILAVMLIACRNENNTQRTVNRKDLKEPLLEANKHAVKTEAQHIDDFLRRYKWDVEETGSGLKYMVYDKGSGPRAEIGMVATVEYKVSLITGDVVYSSDQDGLLSFVIGKAEVISGLEEGILLLNVGDKAKFIIPSHLAYGLVGDDKQIPGKATLIYDITLKKLN